MCYLIDQFQHFNILMYLAIVLTHYIMSKKNTIQQNEYIHSQTEEIKDEIRERRNR